MRSRFALLIGTNLLAAIADVIGLTLVLPLFHLLAEGSQKSSGPTAYLEQGFAAVGIEFTINSVLVLLVAIFLLKFVLVSIAGAVQARLLKWLREMFRARIVTELVNANYRYILDQSQARFLNLYAQEVDSVVGSAKTLASNVSGLVFVFAFVAASLLANWRLTLLTLAMVGMLIGPFMLVMRRSKRLSMQLTDKNQSTQHLFSMLLDSLKYLKATNTARPLIKFAKRELHQRAQAAFKLNIIKVLTSASTEPTVIIFVCLFAFIATTGFGQSPAEIVLPLLFLYRAGMRLMETQRSASGFSQGVGSITALRRGFAELEQAAERTGGIDPGPLLTAITLRSVSYRLGSAQILVDVSMDIPRGATIGLVGETGAGKTSLADLICGLFRPTEGTIAWDGRSYDELNVQRLRSRIGYVTQDPMILNDSILNNITLWGENPDLQSVAAAALEADALGFIERAPNGFATNLGDRGHRLSGGQRQRLALARELYRDPELLIVDEGTSALDSETEELIRASLVALRGRKTVILIAHRLSMLRHCDRIYVLNRGRVTAQGTWDELSAIADEWFGRMLHLQAGGRA